MGKHIPVEIGLNFAFLRPASQRRHLWLGVRPDIYKLDRATLDALTGVLFADDAQVVIVHKREVYGLLELMTVRIEIVHVEP